MHRLLQWGAFFTPLYSLDDLFAHISEWNVLWRLLIIPLIIFNAVLLTCLPYRWRESSASRSWIRTYVAVFILIGVFLLSWMLTQNPVMQVCHTLCSMSLAMVFTWYELMERITVPEGGVMEVATAEPSMADGTDTEESSTADSLWRSITHLMTERQLWRHPDFSVEMLSKELGTNRIHVARSVKEHTGMSFNDFMNSRRVESIAAALRQNPKQNLKDLYFTAGFRSRESAYRNFVKFCGCSPTDFLAQLQSSGY